MPKKDRTQARILINLEERPLIFDYVNNGVAITDKKSTILYTNPAFTKITGYTSSEAIGGNPGMLHSGKHNKKFYQNMWQSILTHGFWEGEIWNRRKSGEIYPEFLTISTLPHENKDDLLYIAIFSDISFLKEDAVHKYDLAFYDPLTKLPNRRLYMERLHRQIEASKKNKPTEIAVFYMDLDKFKEANDTYGHYAGDQLLKQVGKRLSSIVRKEDTIARLGGDEFTALLKIEGDRGFAEKFAKRILKEVEKPFRVGKHKIEVSISIGISFYPQDSEHADDLLIQADEAMYVAKRTNKGIAFYHTLNDD